MKGLSFEEALKRWSSPDRYAAMLELKNPARGDFGIRGSAERKREYRLMREELEDALFERLRRGEVLSSAESSLADPDRPRILVDPEIYEDTRLTYVPDGECIEGSNFRLLGVQLFSRNRIPADLETDPYRPAQPTGLAAFRYDPSYEHVWIGDQEFSLTKFQARIVGELHRAALAGQPWMHAEELREAVRFESETISQLFKRMPNWGKLIRSDKRGNYRLNV